MGVGAAKTERVDPGNPQFLSVFWPGRQFLHHAKLQFFKRNAWIRRVEMQAGGDMPMPHTKRRFDQTGNARRRLQMANVALDRSDQTVRPIRSFVAQCIP